jgi:hypothetical protein
MGLDLKSSRLQNCNQSINYVFMVEQVKLQVKKAKLEANFAPRLISYTSSTLTFPTATFSFVSEMPFLRITPVLAAAEMKRSCTVSPGGGGRCLASWKMAQRLFTTDPTFPATSAMLSPADCPACFSLKPAHAQPAFRAERGIHI